MKNKFAAFTLVSILLAVTPSTVWADVFPKSLPFGTDAIFNSSCQITIALQYTMTGGGLNTVTMSESDYFDSFQSYQVHIAYLASSLFSMIASKTDIASDITFKVLCYCTNTDGSVTYYTVNNDIGSIDTINYWSFLRVIPNVSSVNLSIQNLNYVEVVSSTATNIVNSSANQVSLGNIDLSERIRYLVVLNDGESAVYTQTGEQLFKPVLSINMETKEWWPFYWPSRSYYYNYDITNNTYTYSGPPPIMLTYGQATIYASPGADTVVETSTNMVDWNVTAYLPWNSTASSITVDNWPDYGNYWYFNYGMTPTIDPKWFVRAYSY